MERILTRDGSTCVWCRRTVGRGLVEATTEHVVPRVKGGPSWIENEVAACRRCNARRGHRSPAEWADQCELQGWQPDRDRLRRALEALEERIAEEGGQRRARPYLATQLRRLGRTGDAAPGRR
ncbi:MAG: HNH endonuclease [Actinomycetota bacterium]